MKSTGELIMTATNTWIILYLPWTHSLTCEVELGDKNEKNGDRDWLPWERMVGEHSLGGPCLLGAGKWVFQENMAPFNAAKR